MHREGRAPSGRLGMQGAVVDLDAVAAHEGRDIFAQLRLGQSARPGRRVMLNFMDRNQNRFLFFLVLDVIFAPGPAPGRIFRVSLDGEIHFQQTAQAWSQCWLPFC